MAQQHCKSFQAIDKWTFLGTHENAGVHHVHFLIGHLSLLKKMWPDQQIINKFMLIDALQ